MSYNESDESDCEGFIPNKMIIKRKEEPENKDDSPKLNFEARYITGETVIKKEPPESNLPITHIQRYIHEVYLTSQPEIQEDLPTASERYLSEHFQCVYSRFKRPFGQGSKASFSNEIVIKTLGRQENFRTLKNWRSDYVPTYQQQKTLKFDSKFEGGNLLCAFQSLNEVDTYILFMQNDTNTYGYNQWFNFSIREAQVSRKYTLKIVNFKKRYSFFKKGMQPYIFSLEESKLNGCGWYMDGQGFQYYKSDFSQNQCDAYYTLQFQIEFKHAKDFIMICPSLPYSYTKLIQQINHYQQMANSRGLSFEFESISKSLGGNQVPYLKISKKTQQEKRIIVFTARQHSGQTWSSHLMDEIIKGIASQQDPFFEWIISNFDFHIFPMINVDGVIYGNFRCDLAGYDLNRCWKDPSSMLQPHIFKIKQKIQRLADAYKIDFFLDLHTHSKEHGSFAYSCVESADCRKFPTLVSSITPLFRYPACTYGITNDKKTTARCQVFKLTNNINTMTIQLSAFGYRHPKSMRLQPFTLNNIKAISQSLINSIYYYETKQIPQVIESFVQNSIFSQGNAQFETEKDQGVSGSDSDPSGDEMEESLKIKKILKQLRIHAFNPKIKKTKTRVKKLKANINLSNSPQPKQIEITCCSPVNRIRAATQTKEKKDILQTTIIDCKLLTTTMDPKKTLHSFKKMARVNKFGPSNSLDQSDSTIKIDLNKNQAKPLNLIQFSLKKLPIFPNDKILQAYPLAAQKNENILISSISLTKKIVDQQKLTKNRITTFYRTKKEGNHSQLNTKESYQFLCIMSQSKKQEQIQRIKERREKQNETKIASRLKFNEIKHSTVLQRYLKDKKAENVEVISKIWLNNFNRYSKSLEEPKD